MRQKCTLYFFILPLKLVGVGLLAGACYINWANDDIKSYLEVISFGEDVNDTVDNINTNDNIIQIALYVAMGQWLCMPTLATKHCWFQIKTYFVMHRTYSVHCDWFEKLFALLWYVMLYQSATGFSISLTFIVLNLCNQKTVAMTTNSNFQGWNMG